MLPAPFRLYPNCEQSVDASKGKRPAPFSDRRFCLALGVYLQDVYPPAVYGLAAYCSGETGIDGDGSVWQFSSEAEVGKGRLEGNTVAGCFAGGFGAWFLLV